MTRIAILSVVISIIGGLVYHAYTPDVSIETGTTAKELTPVVYTRTNIPSGCVFNPDLFQIRLIETSRVPRDAIKDISRTKGLMARYEIGSGQILSNRDLAEQPNQTITVSLANTCRIKMAVPRNNY